MPFFAGLESTLERFVEGGFRRLFSPQLQPAEVARALEKAMTERKSVVSSAVSVPSLYEAQLHPADYERLAGLGGVVERDAEAFLARRAVEQGFQPSGQIRVTLVADPSVRRSAIRADCMFGTSAEEEPENVLEPTRAFPQVASPANGAVLVVTAEDGKELRVAEQAVRIGRGSENDLVIRDLRVSRHHVAIEAAGDAWVVRDLGSTNGTYLGGQRVDDVVVDAPVELILGGYRLTLRPD